MVSCNCYLDFRPKLVTIQFIFSGINADLYMLPRDAYGGSNKDNQCFNEEDYAAEDGLQNISPCQYGKSLKNNKFCLVLLMLT